MQIRQWARVLAFGFFGFLPNLLNYWIAAVLPEIIENNLGVKSKQEISKIGGLYFAFYFLGMFTGTLAWPYLLRVCSKRSALLLGLFFQGVFTALIGQSQQLYFVYAARLATGFSNNINTVGKDFIFEIGRAHV